MLVIPAIDLKRGRCVRLLRGRREHETVYSDQPADIALRWESQGAQYLHLVDLDGALEGSTRNLEAVRQILGRIGVPAELGGGIRTLGAMTKLFSLGLDRVILGTTAVSSPEVVERAIERFGAKRIVVGIDATAGRVAIEGWESQTDMLATDVALRMKTLGVERVVYTDIARDGMLTGPNISGTKQLIDYSGLKVIASGGVSSLDDIRRLRKLEPLGVEAVIVGKALYEGAIDLGEAVEAAR